VWAWPSKLECHLLLTVWTRYDVDCLISTRINKRCEAQNTHHLTLKYCWKYLWEMQNISPNTVGTSRVFQKAGRKTSQKTAHRMNHIPFKPFLQQTSSTKVKDGTKAKLHRQPGSHWSVPALHSELLKRACIAQRIIKTCLHCTANYSNVPALHSNLLKRACIAQRFIKTCLHCTAIY
jgi:hypothetical protein